MFVGEKQNSEMASQNMIAQDSDLDVSERKNSKAKVESQTAAKDADASPENVDITDMREPEEFASTDVPDFKDFTPCQLIYVIIMAIVLAFLLGFIIYISFTWNKVRENEYA